MLEQSLWGYKVSQYLIDKLNQLKDQLTKWPDELCTDKDGKTLDPDRSFKIIEADLRETLNKVIMLPENERSKLSDVIESFKQAMEMRQTEAEENLKQLKERAFLNQETSKALKAYGKAYERKNISEAGGID